MHSCKLKKLKHLLEALKDGDANNYIQNQFEAPEK